MSLAADNTSGPGRNRAPRPDPADIARVRDVLDRAGKTVAQWARENGEDVWAVHKVLSGTRACATGAQHRIAVKLGLKRGTIESPPEPARPSRHDFGGMEPAR